MSATCQCGCGQPVKLITRNDSRVGLVRGQWRRFRPGHQQRLIDPKFRYRKVSASGESRLQHVVIAEAALGKSMPKGAQVHHVDNNPRNNNRGNLVICQGSAYHKLLHSRAKVVRAGGNPNAQNICRECSRCKDFSQFHLNKSAAFGVCTICKDCQRTRDAARYLRSLDTEMQLAR